MNPRRNLQTKLMMSQRKRKQPFRVRPAVELSLQNAEEQNHQRKCKDGEFSGGSREKEKDKKKN